MGSEQKKRKSSTQGSVWACLGYVSRNFRITFPRSSLAFPVPPVLAPFFFTLLFNFRIFNYPKIMFFIPFFLYVSFLILLHDATLSRAENFCSISIPTH
jgi:hypothetical protein